MVIQQEKYLQLTLGLFNKPLNGMNHKKNKVILSSKI